LHGDLIPLGFTSTFLEKHFGIVIAPLPSGTAAKENQEKNN
jgi:hypothetical protein